jgi:hypothetical protein
MLKSILKILRLQIQKLSKIPVALTAISLMEPGECICARLAQDKAQKLSVPCAGERTRAFRVRPELWGLAAAYKAELMVRF